MVAALGDRAVPEVPEVFHWRGYRCTYDHLAAPAAGDHQPALVAIHPIGVGLSRRFWDRFAARWQMTGDGGPLLDLYLPDLLGCGGASMPRALCEPADWGAQLADFIGQVVGRPAIVLVQGALFPVAIELAATLRSRGTPLAGLVLGGPPAWNTMVEVAPVWRQRLLWNLLFDGPVGGLFYRYARRRDFLRKFSVKQLFATAEAVDDEWLDTLDRGAADLASRYAVFAFLSQAWKRGYGPAIAQLEEPVLALFGRTASSISRSGKGESPEERLRQYLHHLPNGRGAIIAGRNVLPYEAPDDFLRETLAFVRAIAP
ncbi:MAG: alpha/beta hydrolase [Cyanophyceae cyanobacterium]